MSSESSMSESFSESGSSSSSCQCCDFTDVGGGGTVCVGDTYGGEILAWWPDESACADREITWELVDGPEGITLNELGWVEWDTTDVEPGDYTSTARGVDECGCEYEVTGVITVEECVECCCGHLPNDAGFDVTLDGDATVYVVDQPDTPTGLPCNKIYDNPGAPAGKPSYIRVEISYDAVNEVCAIKVSMTIDGYGVTSGFIAIPEGTECCDISGIEWSNTYSPPSPTVSGTISVNC